MLISFLTHTGSRSLQYFQLARFSALFLISILLARLSGDKILISQYELFLLIAGTFTFFWVNGILKAFLPYYSQADILKRKEIVFHNFLWLCLCSIFSSTAIYFTGTLLYPSLNQEYLLWLVIYTFFSAPSYFTEYLLFAENKRKTLVLFSTITFILMVFAVIIPVFMGKPFVYSLYALVIFSILRFFYLVMLIGKSAKPAFNFNLFMESAIYFFPILLITLAGGFADYFDNILVSNLFTKTDFTLFRYGAREFPIILLLANALSISFSSQIATGLKNNTLNKELLNLKKESLQLMHIAFPLTILLMIFSEPLFNLLYGESFRDAVFIFRIYLLLVISRVVFPQAVSSGLLLNKTMATVSIIELCVHVSLSVLFINIFGIKGVAYASLIAFMLEKIVLGLYLKRRNNIHFSDYIPTGWFLIYSGTLI